LSKTVLAIDIGSTKVCAIIAQINDDETIDITGTGIVRALGLKKGSITNIEQASKSIKAAVEDAKRISGSDVISAVVSISGAYTKSLNSTGIVNIQSKEITFKDIERVMQTSLYNAKIPQNDYDVLHALPYNFKVDNQDYIEDPLGMNAARLEVESHIITTQKSNLNNLKKAVNAAGIEVESVVLNSYASAIATLNEDEKELGAAVIDMGGSTSSISIYAGNSIRFNEFLGVGSNHITNDLSTALQTPLNYADTLKLHYTSLLNPPVNDSVEIPITGNEEATKEVSLAVVSDIAYARVEETLMILAHFIENSGLKELLGAGIVLTGGFSKMDGIRELAGATFGSMPVRLAKPKPLAGLFEEVSGPEFASAIGLVMYMSNSYTKYEIDVNKRVRHPNEIPAEATAIGNLQSATAVEQSNIGVVPPVIPPVDHEESTQVFDLDAQKKGMQNTKEPNVFNKFINWATQLF